MPAQPPKCKLCDHHHWGVDHVLPRVERGAPAPRPPQVQALPVTPSVTSVTNPVTIPPVVTDTVTDACVCPLCGAGHRRGGAMSAAERKRLSRMRARARGEVGDEVGSEPGAGGRMD
jgi:hypothetical protein